MNLHKTKNTNLLAVCCELREGLKNHNLLKNSKKIGDFLSIPNYQLIEIENNSKFNVALKEGDNSVVFEVYLVSVVDLETINKLKVFYYPKYEHNLNNKKIINTPYGKAITYIDEKTKITNENTIIDYDYLDYYNYKTKTN